MRPHDHADSQQITPAQVAAIKRRTAQRNCHNLGVCNCPTSYCQHDDLSKLPPMTRTERVALGSAMVLSVLATLGFAAYLWTQIPLMF